MTVDPPHWKLWATPCAEPNVKDIGHGICWFRNELRGRNSPCYNFTPLTTPIVLRRRQENVLVSPTTWSRLYLDLLCSEILALSRSKPPQTYGQNMAVFEEISHSDRTVTRTKRQNQRWPRSTSSFENVETKTTDMA
jgi:hypothetical protein